MANGYAGYSLYVYNATYPNGRGMAGRISDNGISVSPHPNMSPTLTDTFTWNGDPLVQGFQNPSDSSLDIAVTDRIAGSSDTVRIYNTANGSLGTTVTGGWSNVSNLYAVVPFNGYLYALDYDNARVVEINPSTYAQTATTPYTLPSSLNPDPSTYTAYGQALFEANGALYGLFIFMNPATFAFASSSLLVKFTISGGSSITVVTNDHNSNLASNAIAAAYDGSQYLYVAAIGGSQGTTYNSGSALQKIDLTTANLSTASVTNVMTASASFPYDFLGISIKTGATPTFYILAGVYNSGYTGLNGVLQSTTDFTSFTTIDSPSSVAGYCWSVQYESTNNRIWYPRGNSIVVYNAASTGTPVATLTITSGSLITSGEPYTNLNDFTYVDPIGSSRRSYHSPVQASNSPRLVKARAISKGRPWLTTKELDQLNREFSTK